MHCPQNTLNLRINTKIATVGADAIYTVQYMSGSGQYLPARKRKSDINCCPLQPSQFWLLCAGLDYFLGQCGRAILLVRIHPGIPNRRGVSCVEPLVRYSDSRPDSFACSPPLLSGSRTTLAVGGDGHCHVPNRMREIAATRAQSAVLLSGGKVDLLSAVRDIQEKFKGRVQFFIFLFLKENSLLLFLPFFFLCIF